jgi:hypothetical protein
MTDSDIASSAPPAMSDSLSEVSSRQMMDETMSELEGELNASSSNNDEPSEVVDETDLPSAGEAEAPAPQQPAVMRRRRFVPNIFTV